MAKKRKQRSSAVVPNKTTADPQPIKEEDRKPNRSWKWSSERNESSEELDDKPFETLLQPFEKDQLITLIKKTVEKHPDFNSSVRELADMDPAQRKIFVHGLSWDTTAETLTVEARRALKQPQKNIGNRTTSCQLASQGLVPAPPPTTPPMSEYTQRKIFVSNVSSKMDPEKLLEFLNSLGRLRKSQPHQQGQHENQSRYHHAKNGKYSSSGSETGHLMAPSGPAAVGMGFNPGFAAVGFNPGVAATTPDLNPVLGQALTALLAYQGTGLGLGNLLGGLGGAPVKQGAHAVGYESQVVGGYRNHMGVQGGYQKPKMGQGSAGRTQPGSGAPYMG
ncbi:ABA-responsive element binding protein 3 isoform 1 [Hibiscus syriacus]|uniref:ABA-responsive element binding protein 3 isoform 1 n=1 Tax=Hibiscus syriacus TaxID=106335 RepID=A0A6A3D1B4_HIBSY|nr:ABA-responsive element binding protein 3 isoform 1 [Hibiscus syriacus]